MIDNATRKATRGAKRMLFQDAIAEKLGRSQPKLLEKYLILKEENAA